MGDMMINLHKALKVKNRLVGEYKRLQSIAQRENSKRESELKVDMPGLYKQINDVFEKLIEIKTKICQANIGIYRAIEMMSECKSQMEFYKGLNVNEGVVKERQGLYDMKNGIEAEVYRIVAFINQDGQDQKLKDLQLQINDLQDEIDCYNAKTEIVWNN